MKFRDCRDFWSMRLGGRSSLAHCDRCGGIEIEKYMEKIITGHPQSFPAKLCVRCSAEKYRAIDDWFREGWLKRHEMIKCIRPRPMPPIDPEGIVTIRKGLGFD